MRLELNAHDKYKSQRAKIGWEEKSIPFQGIMIIAIMVDGSEEIKKSKKTQCNKKPGCFFFLPIFKLAVACIKTISQACSQYDYGYRCPQLLRTVSSCKKHNSIANDSRYSYNQGYHSFCLTTV